MKEGRIETEPRSGWGHGGGVGEDHAELTESAGGHLSRAEFAALDGLYAAAAQAARAASNGTLKLCSHLESELGSSLPLHLSLSRPNVLRTEQREGFLETLMDRFQKARVKP